MRHNPDGAQVTASVELVDRVARVVVADDGREWRPRTASGSSSASRAALDATDGGFGLGLAIGRELARQMDGDLVLERSDAGARFALRLPGAPTL